MNKKTDLEVFEKAKERVKKKGRFFRHAVTYIVVNTFIIVISYLFFPNNPTYIWVLGSWTVLVLLDGFNMFASLVIETDENVHKEYLKLKQTNDILDDVEEDTDYKSYKRFPLPEGEDELEE